jgi:hypothetical protein
LWQFPPKPSFCSSSPFLYEASRTFQNVLESSRFFFILVAASRICETVKYALANREAWLHIWLWEAYQIGSFPDAWRRKQSHIPKPIFMRGRKYMKCENNRRLLRNITNHHQHPVRFLKYYLYDFQAQSLWGKQSGTVTGSPPPPTRRHLTFPLSTIPPLLRTHL